MKATGSSIIVGAFYTKGPRDAMSFYLTVLLSFIFFVQFRDATTLRTERVDFSYIITERISFSEPFGFKLSLFEI